GAAENQRHYHADADRKEKAIWSNAGAKRIGKFALQIAVDRKPGGRVGGERGWQQEQYARNGHRDRSAQGRGFVGFTHLQLRLSLSDAQAPCPPPPRAS